MAEHSTQKTRYNALNALDCVSRQAAIAEFSCCQLTPDGGIDANYAIDFLKQMPSAQRTGRWIGVEFGHCSCCGHEGYASDIWDRCENMFCPNCGARMEETNERT